MCVQLVFQFVFLFVCLRVCLFVLCFVFLQCVFFIRSMFRLIVSARLVLWICLWVCMFLRVFFSPIVQFCLFVSLFVHLSGSVVCISLLSKSIRQTCPRKIFIEDCHSRLFVFGTKELQNCLRQARVFIRNREFSQAFKESNKQLIGLIKYTR